MYSNSNTYLGGAGSTRSNPSQYGSSSFLQPQQLQQQPPDSQNRTFTQSAYGQQHQQLQQHQSGYSGPIQAQYKSHPLSSQMQPQYTGFPASTQQNLLTQYTTIPSFTQPSQANSTPSQAPKQIPQSTGMNSSQMADSFKAKIPQQAPQTSRGNSTRIPNIRLSFITTQDQAKFEQLFKSAAGDNFVLSGDQARDLLLRSKLPGDTLSQIWTLSDTTKSGQLFFPEFALAMYLCNLRLNNKAIPASLPETIKNEVSSMVDIISFGVPDDGPAASQASLRANVPSFEVTSSTQVQQPQPQQASSSQLLSQLVSQPTGLLPTFPGNTPAVGYAGPRPPLPPTPNYQMSVAPLNSQPTGLPGQWGLVNAPSSGLPNIEALQAQMMPQQGREGGFSRTALQGNANVPWAGTKDEKKIYDNLFKAWDGFGKGYISGNQAIEIFGQSGLEKPDLEKIWTLSDPSNKGRLDLDEFAVAMHLIYRKLNGYPVPNRLPQELIPPSTRNLNASIGSIKSLLSKDAEERKGSAEFLQPQQTGVSYLKSRSFQRANEHLSANRKDATVFKNNDDDVGYKSSARRRVAGGSGARSPSPATSSTTTATHDELTLEQLQKLIREKQVLLDAMDFQDENDVDDEEVLDQKDRKDSDDLFQLIRSVQKEIDDDPNSVLRLSDSSAERRTLRRKLQSLTDRLPDLTSSIKKTERAIAETRLELFSLRNNSTSSQIIGTGPGGRITESDRLKARAKAMMQQRSAALTGTTVPDNDTDGSRKLEEESSRITAEKESNERMVRDVEESVTFYSKGIEDNLKEGIEGKSTEHERRRWEDGLGVENEVKDFIFDLQRSSRGARATRESSQQSREYEPKNVVSDSYTSSPLPKAGKQSPQPSSTTVYSSYKTAEERAAFIKQQAEQRMAERLAALGIRVPSKQSETAVQRQERDKKEREDRLKQAEIEDAKREQDRQKRLADEQISPPSTSKSAPPPPPSRKMKGEPMRYSSTGTDQVNEKVAGQDLREQQQVQESKTRELEEDERRQEEELRRAKEHSEARQKALEEQVKQGQIRQEEKKSRILAAQKETKEREARLASQRAELEAARERERNLQKQLESLDSGDEDNDISLQAPEHETYVTQTEVDSNNGAPELLETPSKPQQTVSSTSKPEVENRAESKNPYFRRMQSNDQTTPTTGIDTNPFHYLTSSGQQSRDILATTSPRASSRPSRVHDEDDWSVADSNAESSDNNDDDEPTLNGGAKHLASILFGTMAPPRPMSSMDNKDSSTPTAGASPISTPIIPEASSSLINSDPAASVPPPPPPPPPPLPPSMSMPMSSSSQSSRAVVNGGDAPPPPPLPSISGGSIPDRSALLDQIQARTTLKKVQTKDRSESALAGRVV